MLRITLESDTWVRTLGRDARDEGPTRQLLNGLVSAQSEANGWNRIIRPALAASAVRYIDAGEVQIIIPAYARLPLSSSCHHVDIYLCPRLIGYLASPPMGPPP